MVTLIYAKKGIFLRFFEDKVEFYFKKPLQYKSKTFKHSAIILERIEKSLFFEKKKKTNFQISKK